MKITFISTPTPMVTSFTMFAKFPTALLVEKKTLTITARHETKTRVSTSLSLGDHTSLINWEVEGIKTFEKTEWNMFSGNNNTSNYFILNKAQGIEKYKEYLTAILTKLCKNLEIDELSVNLITDKVFK
jgi:hypothetical protein